MLPGRAASGPLFREASPVRRQPEDGADASVSGQVKTPVAVDRTGDVHHARAHEEGRALMR